MDIDQNKKYIDSFWQESVLPSLQKYISIPCKSPLFDPNWEKHGYIDSAAKLVKDWCLQYAPQNSKVEIIKKKGKTPIILVDIPGDIEQTVLLYGHIDKQPEMSGWNEGLEAFKPVLKGDYLYGRGAADDGYAVYAAMTAIKTLDHNKQKHGRIIILIEASEESGSMDLKYYLDTLKSQIKNLDLIICLDSGGDDYDRLWVTTSLRGVIQGTLKVKVLTEAVHSGTAAGIVPSCSRIARLLLQRVEDVKTGGILISERDTVPKVQQEQLRRVSKILGANVYKKYPFYKNAKPITDDPYELLLNNTWGTTLTILGCEGLPNFNNISGVMLPQTQLKLCFRVSPLTDVEKLASRIKTTIEESPPYDVFTEFKIENTTPGWVALENNKWLSTALNEASNNYFRSNVEYNGLGGTIPFMNMLASSFPGAEILVTGILGPDSNAHGPNEALHIPAAKRLTGAIAHVINKHYLSFTEKAL